MPRIVHCFCSYDTAFSDKDTEGAAYSACTRWGVFYDQKRASAEHPDGRPSLMILGAWWERVDMDVLLEKAMEFDRRYLTGPRDAHLVEKKATGHSLIQMLAKRTRTRVIRYDPKNDGGGDKTARAYMVQPTFAAGIVWAPEREWADTVIDLVASFPAGDALSKDVTDTVTQAVNYLRNGWWIVHPDEERKINVEKELSDDDEEDRRRFKRAGRRMAAYG